MDKILKRVMNMCITNTVHRLKQSCLGKSACYHPTVQYKSKQISAQVIYQDNSHFQREKRNH